ncbi:MAG: divergent PAP2 family protein, partial [Clostridium sp.]|jgi:acid phosphatase family membrane protein YuiD|nr:divergent PAP2 family protein [Clostridium sp.]
MPSSHSATVCALLTAVCFEHGPGGFEFAVTFLFAMIVMHDAMGVRRETGKQAQVINDMTEVFKKMGHSDITPEQALKEFVGHSPLQVLAGAVLGILISILLYTH